MYGFEAAVYYANTGMKTIHPLARHNVLVGVGVAINFLVSR